MKSKTGISFYILTIVLVYIFIHTLFIKLCLVNFNIALIKLDVNKKENSYYKLSPIIKKLSLQNINFDSVKSRTYIYISKHQ